MSLFVVLFVWTVVIGTWAWMTVNYVLYQKDEQCQAEKESICS